MRSLFLRVFLGFWATVALMLLVLALTDQWMQRSTGGQFIPAPLAALLETIVREARAAHAASGPPGLDACLRENSRRYGLTLSAVDAEGRQFGDAGAAESMEAAHRALATGRPEVRRFGASICFGMPLSDVRGASLALAARMRLPSAEMWSAQPHIRLAAVAAVILLAGAVCLGLSRFLTAPVRRLQAAAGHLAMGDLSARVARGGRMRRDELGDLERDFDRMAERIERLVAAHRRLLWDVSHELRSPLARMAVAMELLRKDAGPPRPELIERINRDISALDHLIERALELARREAGAARPDEDADCAIAPLIRDICSDAAFEAESRRIRLNCHIESEPICRGSVELLRSAIENVVRNAVKFTADGSDIDVTVRRDADSGDAIVQVHDRGPGIPDSLLAEVRQPFHRADRSEQQLGTGLGLAIAERAIEAHGGTLTIANRVDGGLCVVIRIPLFPPPREALK